jgi:hypothetical protein
MGVKLSEADELILKAIKRNGFYKNLIIDIRC